MLIDCARLELPRGATGSTAPAGSHRGLRVTISGGELYGVPEASGWAARARTAGGATILLLELSSLGGDLYRERTALLEVAHDIAPDATVAARVRGLGIAARGLDDLWTGAIDVAATRRLAGRIVLGASGENITRSRIGASPVAARTGFGAALILPSVLLRGSLQLEGGLSPSTVVSVEVALTRSVRVRAGATDAPRKLGFGVGLGRDGSSWPVVDVACQWHPELGVSTFVSITIAQ
jgi:hypothetical protein